jgi:hypothetical protein
MNGLGLFAVLLAAQVFDEPTLTVYRLPNPFGESSRLQYHVYEDRLEPPARSPKRFGENGVQWEFDWMIPGYAQLPGENLGRMRFRLFSQERKANGDLAPAVMRMLLRMWEYNYFRLGLDHKAVYNDSIVDLYLCWGGIAGGEQLFDDEIVNGRSRKLNTIYIYDLASFASPIEQAREIAHEYGHAALPAIGGFSAPESWANGYLGEKLFLLMFLEGMDKHFIPADVMGVSKADLSAWLAANAYPLADRVAANGPDRTRLAQTGPDAMDAYIGLVLHFRELFPDRVFSRSLMLVGSTQAKDVPAAIDLAMQEHPSLRLSIPARHKGKPIWIPLGGGSVSGATVLKRSAGWALVRPTGTVTVVPKSS